MIYQSTQQTHPWKATGCAKALDTWPDAPLGTET